MSRLVAVPQPGVLRIDQRTRVDRSAIGTDVSGPACVYAHVRVGRGRIRYLRGEERVAAPACFAVLLPPFSIVQAALERCEATTTAFVFLPPPSLPLPAGPVLFRRARRAPAASWGEALDRLAAAGAGASIARAPEAPPLAQSAKALLDDGYAAQATIASVAERLGTAPAVLSRRFRAAYGLPPVRYRHHVRIVDALTRFAAGEVPMDVCLDVGFDDLSRFYKVFRRIACSAPGSYRPDRSRNAKT